VDQPDIDDLRAFCREHLASYKLPSHFVFSTLPKTQTGKIQKTVLREQAKTVT
jgi:fatty-acyl-CoA synthase